MKKKINRRNFIKKASIPVLGAAALSSFNVHASTCLLYTSPSPRDAS